jgi:hypothetical protein
VLAAAAVLDAAGPRALTRHDETAHVLGLLDAWDGRWYRIVAEYGYLLEPGRQSDPAFFPLFPMVLRLIHATGLGYVTSALVLSNVAFLGALAAFAALTRELFGERYARRATIYLALFPLGFVFSMGYPESVVLCAVSLFALAALRRRWVAAAVAGALGALARPETAFIALPLLPLALRERDERRGLALGAVAAPAAALAGFAIYLGARLHDPLAWTQAERAWGRRFTPLGLVTAIERLPTAVQGNAWILRDVICLLVYLVLLLVAWRAGAPRLWVVAGASVVLLPTFSGTFASIARFGLLAPAVFWGLAALGSTRRRDRTLRVVSAIGLLAGTATIPFVFP